jgi:hypothetical protein
MQQDPIGYVDGTNLYGYESSSPVTRLDPFGLQAIEAPPIQPEPTSTTQQHHTPRPGPLPPPPTVHQRFSDAYQRLRAQHNANVARFNQEIRNFNSYCIDNRSCANRAFCQAESCRLEGIRQEIHATRRLLDDAQTYLGWMQDEPRMQNYCDSARTLEEFVRCMSRVPPPITPEQFATGGGDDFAACTPAVIGD